jgi:hypothetical protein
MASSDTHHKLSDFKGMTKVYPEILKGRVSFDTEMGELYITNEDATKILEDYHNLTSAEETAKSAAEFVLSDGTGRKRKSNRRKTLRRKRTSKRGKRGKRGKKSKRGKRFSRK